MSFTGFTNEDFQVFQIDGLDQRMEALVKTIRPKLDDLGNYFAPSLATLVGTEMYPHVAKHARRTKNPPNDTWVAIASSKRGYKMLPHFQIGLWETHLFIWFAMIYEAPNKGDFGRELEKHVDTIYDATPENFVWSVDHMKPEAILHNELTKDELKAMFLRLQTVKKSEILCGYHIMKEEAIAMSPSDFLERTESVFKKLIPLYKLA